LLIPVRAAFIKIKKDTTISEERKQQLEKSLKDFTSTQNIDTLDKELLKSIKSNEFNELVKVAIKAYDDEVKK